MIDLILNALVAVIVISIAVIFPVFIAARKQEMAQDQARSRATVWYKGEPLVMGLIGLFCGGLYLLMLMELNARTDQASLLVIGAVLLLLPTATGFAALLALYHILLWIRRR